MRVVVESLDKGKVPPAEKFLEAVAGRLVESGVGVNAYNWKYHDARRDPAFEDLVSALPHVRYREQGYRDALLVLDVARFEEVLAGCLARQEVQAQREAAEAEGGAVLADEAARFQVAAEWSHARDNAVAQAVEAARVELDARKRDEVLGHLRRAATPAQAFQAILIALGGVKHEHRNTVASIAGINKDRLPWNEGGALDGAFKVSKQVTAEKLLRAVAYALLSGKDKKPWTRLACIWQGKDFKNVLGAATRKATAQAEEAFLARVGPQPVGEVGAEVE